MSSRILTILLAVALVVLAAYFLAFQQRITKEADLRAGEITAPVSDAAAFAELRWYSNQLESLAIEGYSRDVGMDEIRVVMHEALDAMWQLARVEADSTRRCDFIQCNPKLCAPWCPTIDTEVLPDPEE